MILFHKFNDDEVSNIKTKLLVSCPSDNNSIGGLFYLDFENNKLKKIIEGDCRGIVAFKKNYYLIVEPFGLIKLDENLNIKNVYKLKSLDLHGIVAYKNKFFITETATDTIGVYWISDLEKIDSISPIKSPGLDKCHINDLCVDKNILYISMFSFSGKWKEKEKNFDGVVLAYDLDKKKIKKILKKNLQLPHSIYKKNNSLFYCESLALTISNQDNVIAYLGGYTRGLYFDSRFFFVGQSQMRHLDRILSKLPNISIDCGIHIFDSVNRTNRFITLPTKQVYSIIQTKTYRHKHTNYLDMGSLDSIKYITNLTDWHCTEGEFRWMSKNKATVKLLKRKKENNLVIEAMSGYPKKYILKIYLNSKLTKKIVFNKPGKLIESINIQNITSKIVKIKLQVGKTWIPKECYGSTDERQLGIALYKMYIK